MSIAGESPSLHTITVNSAALAALEAARSSGESVSDVILRAIRPATNTPSVADILRTFREADISTETIDLIDEAVARRRSSLRRGLDQ